MNGSESANERVRIVCAEYCGNAPKKILIRDFEIAMAKKEVSVILENLTSDCVWEIIGIGVFNGIDRIQWDRSFSIGSARRIERKTRRAAN